MLGEQSTQGNEPASGGKSGRGSRGGSATRRVGRSPNGRGSDRRSEPKGSRNSRLRKDFSDQGSRGDGSFRPRRDDAPRAYNGGSKRSNFGKRAQDDGSFRPRRDDAPRAYNGGSKRSNFGKRAQDDGSFRPRRDDAPRAYNGGSKRSNFGSRTSNDGGYSNFRGNDRNRSNDRSSGSRSGGYNNARPSRNDGDNQYGHRYDRSDQGYRPRGDSVRPRRDYGNKSNVKTNANNGESKKNTKQQEFLTELRNKGSLMYGVNAVQSILQNKSRTIFKLILTQDRRGSMDDAILEPYIDKIEIVNSKTIDEIMGFKDKHQSIIAYVGDIIEKIPLDGLLDQGKDGKMKLFILDEVQDPHNVGAIIRSAKAFGIDAIIMPRHNSPSVTVGVVRSSAGYSEQINIYYVANLCNVISKLKEYKFTILGFDCDGDDINNAEDFKENLTCYIFGSEGEGIRQLTKKQCDKLVRIPIVQGVDSINVSNAAAIVAYLANANT